MIQSPKRSPLHQSHLDLSARMIDFAGWQMPGWFTSIVEEHRAVRTNQGIFDISHLGRIEIKGRDATTLLQQATTNDMASLPPGRAQYTLFCQEDGGILDDPVVYRLDATSYLLTANASNTDKDFSWLMRLSPNLEVRVEDRSSATVMFALQGPKAVDLLDDLCQPRPSQRLKPFGCVETTIGGSSAILARTGYTGEDGFEIIAPVSEAESLWKLLLKKGARPCGLGARDTLRLEAGFVLYGQDIDASTNPFEADLGWLVDFSKEDFAGRTALLNLKRQGIQRKLVCFRMLTRELARSGYLIIASEREVGRVTSASYSPTLNASIGMGYVTKELAQVGSAIIIDIRGKRAEARVVKRPFYRRPEVKSNSV